MILIMFSKSFALIGISNSKDSCMTSNKSIRNVSNLSKIAADLESKPVYRILSTSSVINKSSALIPRASLPLFIISKQISFTVFGKPSSLSARVRRTGFIMVILSFLEQGVFILFLHLSLCVFVSSNSNFVYFP
uniref:Uncharacterized protein n=1 Tax=Lepeophtheirus salmonis TaxID=72036 RepID=A0A0K2TTN2_LEPSM